MSYAVPLAVPQQRLQFAPPALSYPQTPGAPQTPAPPAPPPPTPGPSGVAATPAPLTLEQQHITAVEGIVPTLQCVSLLVGECHSPD